MSTPSPYHMGPTNFGNEKAMVGLAGRALQLSGAHTTDFAWTDAQRIARTPRAVFTTFKGQFA